LLPSLQHFWAYHEDFEGQMFISLPQGCSVDPGEHIVLRNDHDQEVEVVVASLTKWGCYVKW
jgi:hypothetical protein